jgi:antitoxin VapB
MDDPLVVKDALEKQERVRDWLSRIGADGVIISRRDQFAWLTSGGDNRVLNNSENGFGHLVITKGGKQYLVAQSMDAARLLEEQAPNQGYEMVSLHWFEEDARQKALKLAGRQVVADSILAGAKEINSSLAYLHFPLTNLEMTRSRWLGRAVAELLENVGLTVAPGQSEQEIAIRLNTEAVRSGIDLDVLIVGSDERIFKYRHPLPTSKTVRNYVLLHPAARKWGLHANVSRSLHFGEVPSDIQKAYQAVATIEARILGSVKEGLGFAELLTMQKDWYAELGYPLEWQNHYQGGPTGYLVVDTGRNQTETRMQKNQTFDWFVTVTGAKVEELSLLTDSGVELASRGSNWPGLVIPTSQGPIDVPGLWIR